MEEREIKDWVGSRSVYVMLSWSVREKILECTGEDLYLYCREQVSNMRLLSFYPLPPHPHPPKAPQVGRRKLSYPYEQTYNESFHTSKIESK